MAIRPNATSYVVTSTTPVRYQVASGPAIPSGSDWSIALWHGPDNATGSITEFLVDVGNAATNSASTFHLYFWEASGGTPRKYQFSVVGSEGTASSHTVTSTNAVTVDGTWRLIVINYTSSTKTFALKICAAGGSVSSEGSTTKSDFAGIASGKIWSFFRREVDDLRGQRNPTAEFSFQSQTLSDANINALAAGAAITSLGITPVLYFPFTTAQQTQTNQGSASSSDATASNSSDIGTTVTHPFSAGSPSGTVAVTNANDTSSASGTPIVTGTVAKTNANDTASASGATGSDPVGAAAIVNAADTASASGTVLPSVTITELVDGGSINLSTVVTTANGASPITRFSPRVQACTDISATARWWGFAFTYQADQATTPIFEVRTTSPAEWHLATLGDSLTAWRPAYSIDGGVTWQRATSQSAGTVANGADANHRNFTLGTIPAKTPCIVANDTPRGLTIPAGVEDTLAGWIAAHPTKFQPSATAQALTNPSYTPTYGGSTLVSHIAWMTTAGTREDGAAVPSLPAYGTVLDDLESYPETGNSKVEAIFICGGHPSEGVGRKIMTAAINQILQSSTNGNLLRKYVRFRIFPNINPAGEYSLYWRSTPEQVTRDYNRHFDSSNSTVTNRVKTALTTEVSGKPLAAFCDFHGEGNTTPTVYGRQTDAGYLRFKSKLIAKRPSTDFSLDADDGKRSWNWGKDTLGAAFAAIIERETIGTPDEADRELNGQQIADSLAEYLSENLLIAVPQGTFQPGVATTVWVQASAGGRTPALPSGVTPTSSDLGVIATNATVGAISWVSASSRWEFTVTPTAAGAGSLAITNTLNLINTPFTFTAATVPVQTPASGAPGPASGSHRRPRIWATVDGQSMTFRSYEELQSFLDARAEEAPAKVAKKVKKAASRPETAEFIDIPTTTIQAVGIDPAVLALLQQRAAQIDSQMRAQFAQQLQAELIRRREMEEEEDLLAIL